LTKLFLVLHLAPSASVAASGVRYKARRRCCRSKSLTRPGTKRGDPLHPGEIISPRGQFRRESISCN
jgi:hypothetical protein